NVSKLSGGTSGVDDPAVRNKAAVTLKPEDFQVVDVEAQDSSDWMAYDASASISVSQNGLELTNVEMLNIKKTKARYSNCNALTSFDSRATVPISDHTAGDYLCFRATSNHRILAGHILSIDRTSKAIRVDLMSWELPS
ncbi:MAG: hypothetical protein QOE58_2329, partial [Actinomycetota bacterium]|nr:hypothetical protein [Actinomycetota bacterium]